MLLSRGGSVDAMQMFRDFTGGEPDIQPLLDAAAWMRGRARTPLGR